MGKGDKKSRRGKIWIGSFGVTRPRKVKNKNANVINTAGKSKPDQKTRKGEKNK